MKQEIEILNLPMSAVTRISKLVAPNIKFTEEAKLAVNRAAGMFVLYTSMMAWEVATTQKRKTIRSTDIIKFLNDSGQEDIVAALSTFDDRFKKAQKSKNSTDEVIVLEDQEVDEGRAESSCTLANSDSSSDQPAKPLRRAPVEHVIPQEHLEALRSSPALLKLLQSSTNLRSLLVWIDRHPTPSAAFDYALKEPDFRRFCSLCLNTLSGEPKGSAVTLGEQPTAESMIMALLNNDYS
ncbi:DNA polymerase epsilon subunit 3 [Trichuris trichiura]|uniref:DNA polymerase epsilon subunit 3 n=1 Tax=Trichuris trichiura TaxID=36087 RepID=A0A077Z8S6_TRITR|nr:DNA polymerase epsilon subunit 3 [Trichuris trichiura]